MVRMQQIGGQTRYKPALIDLDRNMNRLDCGLCPLTLCPGSCLQSVVCGLWAIGRSQWLVVLRRLWGSVGWNSVAYFADLGPCQLVAALVITAAGMTSDPVPVNDVARCSPIKGAPEVLVFYRLPLDCAPTTAFPCVHPSRYSQAQVLGVGPQFNLAWLFEGVQRFNSGLQLHAVTCGCRRASGDFTVFWAVSEDGGPAAGSRISLAGAVGVNRHLLQFAGPGMRKRGLSVHGVCFSTRERADD